MTRSTRGPRRRAPDGGRQTADRARLRSGSRATAPPASAPTRAGDLSTELLDLQRDAGNRAVAQVIQRQKDPTTLPRNRDGFPTRGPDVREALRARYPALLGALTAAQLDQWQKVVDYYTIKWEVDRLRARLWDEFAYYGTVRSQHPDYIAKRRKLDRAVPSRPDENLTVDVRLLLADDVKEEPQWDVKAELVFRQWAVEQITKEPLKLDLRPQPDEALAQHPMPGIAHKTKGFITANDLRSEFRAEYDAWVAGREELVKLRQALDEANSVWVELRQEHAERSRINEQRIGWGIVRHISEALGSGDADYPTIRIWDEPLQLIQRAYPLLRERKYELAVPIIAMAEQATAQCAQRYLAYEKRVTTGAMTAVKWLGRLKAAGTVAAGIASGGLGLTGAALAAGGYTLAQEGAGRIAEMHYGQRQNLGAASLIKAAGVTALMTLLGGSLQARFQVAIKARIDQIPNLAGTKLAELTSSALAAGTSSVYVTASELAIKAVVDGKALPKDARALANLVIDNAIENIAMDLGLHGANNRVAREYAAWRSGQGKPAVTVPGEVPPDVARPDVAAPPDQAPRKLPAEAVRSLLTEAGGWERLHAELQSGTGLAANMPLPERRAMIDRFEAHREVLARNVTAVFGGEVVITDAGPGRQIEVRFAGSDSPDRVQQAKDYLDAKSPGWEQQTAVRLTADPRSTGTRQDSQAVADHLSPEARALVDEFVPLFERWQALKTPDARMEALLAVVNKQLVAAGAPPLIGGYLDAPRPGDLGKLAQRPVGRPGDTLRLPLWELHVHRELLARAETDPRHFALVADTFAHEARHALQYFRMARLHLETHLRPGETLESLKRRLPDDRLLNSIDPMVLGAAMQANAGTRPAESFRAGEMKREDARAYYESVFGTGRNARNKIYEDMDIRLRELDTAERRLELFLELPVNDRQRVDAQARVQEARARYDQKHKEYELLVEEIDARTHGEDVARGVRQRLAELRALDRARQRHRQAYNEYRAASDAMLAVRHRLSLEQRKKEREAAFRRFEAAANIVKKLQDRLERAAAKRAGQP